MAGRVALAAAVRAQLRPFPVLREQQLRKAVGMRERRGQLASGESSRQRRGLELAHAVELDRY